MPTRRVQLKEVYLECLKQHGNAAEQCRELAKSYLKCRMERWVGGCLLALLTHP